MSRSAPQAGPKKPEAEERKTKVGLSTNYTVFQVQRDLATVQSQELKARIDYVLSLGQAGQGHGDEP
jgi:outer membrane protein TolC